MNHLLSAQEVTRADIERILLAADEASLLVNSDGGCACLKYKVLGMLFMEPSTRTCLSFQAAMQRLGGSTVCLTAHESSMQKGESFEDTVKTLSAICDAIVIRQPKQGLLSQVAMLSDVPIINGGNFFNGTP